MKNYALLALVAFAFAGTADAAKYAIDPGHTQVQFTYSHFGFSNITGRFDQVSGDLTIHGVTKPTTLTVKVNGIGNHPMKKIPAAGFDASTVIKRSDFGVGAYVPAVSDEVRISITLEATEAK